MGLSDGERRDKIFFCIKGINAEVVALRKKLSAYGLESYESLLNHCDMLWHAFLGEHTNSAHWLLGSDSTRVIHDDDSSVWATAIRTSLPSIEKDYDNNDKWILCEDYFPFDDDKYRFNVFADGYLGIYGLLQKSHSPGHAHVYRIYQYLETLSYALRRYPDEFLTSLEALSIILSDLTGDCFALFSSEKEFAQAYVLHQVCIALYGEELYYINDKPADVVEEWLCKQNVHHDLPRVMQEENLSWITERHLALINVSAAEKLTLRALTALECLGDRFYYDHQHSDMLAILSKHKDFELPTRVEIEALAKKMWEEDGCPEGRSQEIWLEAESRFSITAVKALLKKCQVAHAEKEEQDRARYQDDHHEVDAYGG